MVERTTARNDAGSNEGTTLSLRMSSCPCGRPRISSSELFPDGCSEICVEHEGMEYCLRITKQKKLILYR